MQELTIKASIPELIAKRGMALNKIEQAITGLKDALALANDACIGGKQNASSSLVDAIRDQIRFGRVAYDAEKIRIALDRSMWRSFVVNTPLWSLMDTKARKQFDVDMAGIPPEATEENLRATMALYFADADQIFRRSLIETFRSLPNEYASNNAFKLDKKIILGHIQDRMGYFSHYADDRIRDLDRVFWVLDGKEYPADYNAGLPGVLRDAVCRARGNFTAGAGTCETEYFSVRFFKNGNAHATFKRPDLVLKANRMIAEYYGETLPGDTGRAEPEPTRDDLDDNYFPTPDAVIDTMLSEAEIENGMRILEPSAGDGRILHVMLDCWPESDIRGYEINPDRARDAGVRCFDFMQVFPVPEYDRIIMNPPFSHGRWYKHVLHAYKFLKPGGRLVAIIPNCAINKKHQEEWNLMMRGFVNEIPLPKGTFKESDTMIETRILVVEK